MAGSPYGGWVERLRMWMGSVDAAALAGALSAVLMLVSMYLLSRQPGIRSAEEDLEWYGDSANRLGVLIGLNLGAVAIVAFLWFMAVVRRRLGDREDRFFATVFLGSGLSFGVLAIAAAVAASSPTLVVQTVDSASLSQDNVALAHASWIGLWGVGASRLAGVFMAATSTVGMRFGAFPRWLSTFGLAVGVAFGITGAFIGPLDFLFPAWLLVVSLTLLIMGRRHTEADQSPA